MSTVTCSQAVRTVPAQPTRPSETSYRQRPFTSALVDTGTTRSATGVTTWHLADDQALEVAKTLLVDRPRGSLRDRIAVDRVTSEWGLDPTKGYLYVRHALPTETPQPGSRTHTLLGTHGPLEVLWTPEALSPTAQARDPFLVPFDRRTQGRLALDAFTAKQSLMILEAHETDRYRLVHRDSTPDHRLRYTTFDKHGPMGHGYPMRPTQGLEGFLGEMIAEGYSAFRYGTR